MTFRTLITATALGLGLGTAGLASATQVTHMGGDITEEQVLEAQQAWGEALVAISHTYEEEGIDAASTLAEAPQTSRTTPEGTLAYFVGHSDEYSADSGFALKGWQEVTIDNAAIFISGDMALTMGTVSILDADGYTTTVDKSWGYHLDDDGDLRIVLHHSSLPFTGDE